MMANNMSSRQAGHAARYVVARVLRGLFWCLKYTVILPLATMALMALFVLWKDNTTPGKLLVKEINFVRQTAPPDSSRSVNAGFLPLIFRQIRNTGYLPLPRGSCCRLCQGD